MFHLYGKSIVPASNTAQASAATLPMQREGRRKRLSWRGASLGKMVRPSRTQSFPSAAVAALGWSRHSAAGGFNAIKAAIMLATYGFDSGGV